MGLEAALDHKVCTPAAGCVAVKCRLGRARWQRGVERRLGCALLDLPRSKVQTAVSPAAPPPCRTPSSPLTATTPRTSRAAAPCWRRAGVWMGVAAAAVARFAGSAPRPPWPVPLRRCQGFAVCCPPAACYKCSCVLCLPVGCGLQVIAELMGKVKGASKVGGSPVGRLLLLRLLLLLLPLLGCGAAACAGAAPCPVPRCCWPVAGGAAGAPFCLASMLV